MRVRHICFKWNDENRSRTYKSFESNEELEDYVLEMNDSDSEFKIIEYGLTNNTLKTRTKYYSK